MYDLKVVLESNLEGSKSVFLPPDDSKIVSFFSHLIRKLRMLVGENMEIPVRVMQDAVDLQIMSLTTSLSLQRY